MSHDHGQFCRPRVQRLLCLLNQWCVSLEVARVDVNRSSSLDTEQSSHVLLIKKKGREREREETPFLIPRDAFE